MALATALIPHLIVHDGNAAIEYYKKALGAVEIFKMPAEDGKRVMHARLMIGSIVFYLCDDFPEYCNGVSRSAKALGNSPVVLHLDVPNCDEAIAQAAGAGGTVNMPAADMFWGDRYGQVIDPFGHHWSFCHPLKQGTPEVVDSTKA